MEREISTWGWTKRSLKQAGAISGGMMGVGLASTPMSKLA
jgi:hypothetical protein